MSVKPLVWVGNSLEAVRGFPDETRRIAGVQLRRVQLGDDPYDWKPMPGIGVGVREIRLRSNGAYRILYLARFPEAVYVLHAFEKRSRKTAMRDLELAATRLRIIARDRRPKLP
jgi:phage-related protein